MRKRVVLRVLAIVFGTSFLHACAPAPTEAVLVGYVEAEWVYVAAPQSGWLLSRPVDRGDEVTVGDILFELDDEQQLAVVAQAQGHVEQARAQALDISSGARQPEILERQARLDEAKAQLEEARLEKERIEPLVVQNLDSESNLDAAVAAYKAAKARVDVAIQSISVARQAGRPAAQDAALAAASAAAAALDAAQWSLGQRTARARTGGRVEEVFHYPGEFVTAGAPVLAIQPPDALKVRFFVPQAKLADVTVGQTVQVRADGMTGSIVATVSYISATAEFTPPVIYSVGSREKLVFMVEAKIGRNDSLHPGLPVDVSGL